MKNTIIKDVMSVSPITLHPKDKISRAKEIFKSYRIHHIPVAINSKIVGIISLGDMLAKENRTYDHMLEVEAVKNISMLTVDEIMTKNPVTKSSSEELHLALKIMNEKRINCIPIEDDGKLVGILTSYDIIEFLLKAIG